MRGFPLNMSPGSLDDQQPGFPYFAGSAEVKFEFGYGPGSFHPDFFGHHGGPHPGGGPGGPFGHPGKNLKFSLHYLFYIVHYIQIIINGNDNKMFKYAVRLQLVLIFNKFIFSIYQQDFLCFLRI